MEELPPQLLDLISRNREWLKNREEAMTNKRGSHGFSEEKKLELRLGLPGQERDDESLLSLGYFPSSSMVSMNPNSNGMIRQTTQKFSSPSSCTKMMDLHCAEKKQPFSSPSQKRTAPVSVVGWPPVRSFRKNLASNNNNTNDGLKSPGTNQSQNVVTNKAGGDKTGVDQNVGSKGLFVKINMDGVPIGRKVDLNAYDTYENLSSAIDQLFRGLLAAQRESCGGMNSIEKNEGEGKEEEEKSMMGLLDGSGEYTLVYEDNEGDRMLAGDVPWHMFVSTVKRLRVLKSSELPALRLGGTKPKIR